MVLASVVGAGILLIARHYKRKREKLKLESAEHTEQLLAERYCPHFNAQEIQLYTTGYIEPDCSQVDPANEYEFGKFAHVRESVFQAVDRFFFEGEIRSHLLILADSGVGKTSFCVNYYQRRAKNRPVKVALISLAQPEPIKHISAVPSKTNTILILDALDEDPSALRDGTERLYSILRACSEFRGVIVTCRTHFFENDAAIPTQTGIARITPRAAQGGSYDLSRLYLLPFTDRQVDRFLNKKIGFIEFSARKRARELVSTIPELSARPMLLSLVPDLSKKSRRYYELYELYEYMVDSWYSRESKWIDPSVLSIVTNRLAVYLSKEKQRIGIDRASPEIIADKFGNEFDIDWKLLTSRSLLNRDSEGFLKFAHRSIMEFLCVRLAIQNDPSLAGVYWTDFMRELLYSFASISTGNAREVVSIVKYLQDNRAKTRFPHADPLPESGIRTKNDLLHIAANHRIDHGSRRDIPIGLRYTSIDVDEHQDYFRVLDREYGLKWTLPNVFGKNYIADPLLYRIDVKGASGPIPNDQANRPSFAQFISLVEVHKYCFPDVGFIFPQHFYWLGDRMYGGVLLLASLENTLPEGSGQLILSSFKSGGQTERANLYAIDPAKVRRSGNISGLDLRVARFSE